MSEEISVYNALVTPVNGTDPPLDQTLDYITQGLPFKTLDYLYTNFRILFPIESLTLLSVEVTQGISNMALTDIPYDLLILSNPNNNAKIIAQGSTGKSLPLNSVTFNINTDLIVPYQPYQDGTIDVPVVTTTDFLIFNQIFNVLSDNPVGTSGPSMTRDIIVSDGFVLTDKIDSQNSKVDLNVPYSVFYSVKLFASMLLHSSINLNSYSSYVTAAPETSGLTVAAQLSTVNYSDPPPVAALAPDPCNFGQLVKAEKGLFIAFGIVTAGIGTLLTAGIWAIWSAVKCGSTAIPSSVRKQQLINFLNKDKCKVFMRACSINPEIFLQPQAESVTLQGPGTIQYLGDNPIILSKDPATILGLNLLGVTPFSSDVSLDASEYNLIQDNDSYNNSGSIFRRAHIITSDYTLTQFDGEIFLVDASGSDIIITIPLGDISKNRLMEFKRIDTSSNNVIIISPGGIDLYKVYKLDTKKCKDGCKSKRLPYVRLFGDGSKLWILE